MKKEFNMLEINLGLGNNPKAKELIQNTEVPYLLEGTKYFCDTMASKYNNKEELVKVYKCYNFPNYKLSKVIELIEKECLVYEQECISIVYRGQGILVYSPEFPSDKKRYNFDNKLFKKIY